MAIGPFARVMTQVVLTVGGAVGRAVSNAWKEAAMRGAGNPTTLQNALTRRMTLEEAAKILEVDLKTATQEKITERANHMVNINAPSGEFIGSPYLQRKVKNAETVLSESLSKK
jgi:hypothetical protein